MSGGLRADRPATVGELLAAARGPGRADAEVLLAHVLGRGRAWLYAHAEVPVDAGPHARYEALLARCLAGEPVAYLTGRREFWSLDLEVGPATLVPRPETELLVEHVLALIASPRARGLDLGTGSGAIAVALASERPGWQLIGVDVDPAAVRIAAANARRLGLANIGFLCGDWYAPIGQRRFEFIVSNPPYIRAGDPCLEGPGLSFEPRSALAAGADGLLALRRVVGGARAHLCAGGLLACEHGADQGASLRALMAYAGLTRISTHRDLAGLERLTLGFATDGICRE